MIAAEIESYAAGAQRRDLALVVAAGEADRVATEGRRAVFQRLRGDGPDIAGCATGGCGTAR